MEHLGYIQIRNAQLHQNPRFPEPKPQISSPKTAVEKAVTSEYGTYHNGSEGAVSSDGDAPKSAEDLPKMNQQFSLSRPGPWKKKFERLIFPTQYVIPKSLKFGHWLSENSSEI